MKMHWQTALLAALLCCLWWGSAVEAQIPYRGHLSELRIKELNLLATRLELSINPEKYACDSYFDYVCSRNRPLFSIMGGYCVCVCVCGVVYRIWYRYQV